MEMVTNVLFDRRLRLLGAAVLIIALLLPAGYATAKKPTGWMNTFANIMYGGPDQYAMKLVEYDGMIVVGGEFTEIGGALSSIAEANNIAAFDEDEWLSLSTGVTGGDLSSVFALAVYDGDLIVGGNFTNAGSVDVRNIARWDGENWYPMAEGVGNDTNTGKVYALFVWNGELYAGGRFNEAGTETVSNVARWDGASWSPVGSGRPTIVHEFCEFNGNLVAGGLYNGDFRSSVGIWNGSIWSGVGIEGHIYALTTYEYGGEERLIAGGFFFGESGIYNLAYYVGGYTWLEFEGGVIHTEFGSFAAIQDLQVYDNNLVVSGYFTEVGGQEAIGIAVWNQRWKDLEGGIEETGRGFALLIDEREKCIYLAGSFCVTGKTKTENMGKYVYGKTTPGPPSVQESEIVKDFTAYPNPFNPVTMIAFSLDSPANVRLKIYDISGRCIATLMDSHQETGAYSLAWDGKDNLGNTVSSGIYFAKLNIGDSGNRREMTKKLILLR